MFILEFQLQSTRLPRSDSATRQPSCCAAIAMPVQRRVHVSSCVSGTACPGYGWLQVELEECRARALSTYNPRILSTRLKSG